MFGKLASLLKQSNKATQNSKTIGSKAKLPQQPNTVDPTHIGNLGEFKIEVQLRQFPEENRYLNDLLIPNPRSRTGFAQIDHILITPYAVFVIETKNYKGRIYGKREERYWSVNGKRNMYNPLQQNRTHVNALRRVLKRYGDIRLISVVSFTKRCELHVDPELTNVEFDQLAVYDVRLTDIIERKLIKLKAEYKTPTLSDADVRGIYELVSSTNIDDPVVREEHNRRIHEMKKNQLTSD